MLKLVRVYPFVSGSLRTECCRLVASICVSVVTFLAEKIDLIELDFSIIIVIGRHCLKLRIFLATGLCPLPLILVLLLLVALNLLMVHVAA